MTKLSKKSVRELKTIALMMAIYCRKKHGQNQLCPQCQKLYDYTSSKIKSCKLTAKKTTCAKCSIHCFKLLYRDQVRQVMRYAGPRMIYRHPYLALRHLLDTFYRSRY